MGVPGSPGMGMPQSSAPMSPFGAQPQQPPAACQKLIVMRDETQKAGSALKAAGEKKAPPARGLQTVQGLRCGREQDDQRARGEQPSVAALRPTRSSK